MYNYFVYIQNLGEIKAVAFDIDGTLYRTWKLNVRIAGHFLPNSVLFMHYGLVRKTMHTDTAYEDFSQSQAELVAKRTGEEPDIVKQKLEKIVYKDLEKFFPKIKPCKGVIQLIKDLKAAGFKVAALSDFPPEQKGNIWGLRDVFDVSLGTEEIGALKPSPISFLKLADALEIPAEQVLFVGNSHKYDVKGAKAAGMKAAWFSPRIKTLLGRKSKLAEITFRNYRQLRKILLPDTIK